MNTDLTSTVSRIDLFRTDPTTCIFTIKTNRVGKRFAFEADTPEGVTLYGDTMTSPALSFSYAVPLSCGARTGTPLKWSVYSYNVTTGEKQQVLYSTQAKANRTCILDAELPRLPSGACWDAWTQWGHDARHTACSPGCLTIPLVDMGTIQRWTVGTPNTIGFEDCFPTSLTPCMDPYAVYAPIYHRTQGELHDLVNPAAAWTHDGRRRWVSARPQRNLADTTSMKWGFGYGLLDGDRWMCLYEALPYYDRWTGKYALVRFPNVGGKSLMGEQFSEQGPVLAGEHDCFGVSVQQTHKSDKGGLGAGRLNQYMWPAPYNYPSFTMPKGGVALNEGVLYWAVSMAGADVGKSGLYAFEMETGVQKWFVEMADVSPHTVVDAERARIYTVEGMHVVSRSLLDGSAIWLRGCTMENLTPVGLCGDLLYVLNPDNSLFALRTGDGALAWAYGQPLAAQDTIVIAAGQDRPAIVVIDADLRILMLEAATGAKMWRSTYQYPASIQRGWATSVPNAVRVAAMSGNRLLISSLLWAGMNVTKKYDIWEG